MRRIFLPMLLLPVAALAQPTQVTPDLRDVGSARSLAMGGAYESLGYGTEALAGNPAAISIYKRYTMEAHGAWDIPLGYGFAGTGLIDATNELAAGVSYTFATFGGFDRRWAHVTTLAASYAFSNLIHVGAALRHQAIVGASNTNSVTMNAGLLFRPIEYLSIGFSGHNLIGVYNKDISRYFVASVSGQFFNQLSPAVDVRMDFNEKDPKVAVHAGIEWLIAQIIPLRVGYQWDGVATPNHHYISFGTGYFNEGSGIDLAYRHEIGGLNGRQLVLSIKLQM